MADVVNVGTTANDGNGDTLRSAFSQINARFNTIAGTLTGGDAWAAGVTYTSTPVRNWVVNAGQAYVAASNHVSGATFAADYAAGKWLAVDVAQLIADLAASSGASLVGYLPAGTGAVATTVQGKLRESVSVKDFGAVGDGVADDRLKLIAAMNDSALGGRTLFIPDGVYAVSNWLPIPSDLKMVFSPGAVWRLTAATTPGGFVIGGYDISLVSVPFENVEIHGMSLECNNIPGENGFSALNASNVRLLNPKIKNVLHDPTSLGGRAFQFEGGTVDGVHIYSPYIEDCSIGINSQGDPAGTTVVRNVNYYDVVMRNVDIPFNVDSQYANPETNTALTMSTSVYGASLFNCGKITWPGDTSSGAGGGIVCGDRGAGLSIHGLRIINTAGYGACGALVRGVLFNIHINDVHIDVPYMPALFDFAMNGFGSPGAGTFASTVYADRITVKADLDYIVKGGPSTGRIGNARFSGIEINSTTASLAGLVDSNAGASTTAFLDLVLKDGQFKTSGLRSLLELFIAGNTIGVCQPTYQEGPWTPVDASGAGLVFSVSGTPWYTRCGRLVTANCRIEYPATANSDNAIIGGLPFTAANLSSMGGVGQIAYCTIPTLSAIYVTGNTKTAPLSSSSGVPIVNSAMSSGYLFVTFTYFAE